MMALPQPLTQTKPPLATRLWLPWFALAGLLLLWLYSFAVTWLTMVKIWYSIETFAHCFFIIPISLYLIWQRRAALSCTAIGFSWWPVGLHFCLLLGWLFGLRLGIQVIEQFAVLAMLPNFVWLIWGSAKCRVILFPLLYSLFALPFGEFLIPSLQHITAEMSVWLLRLSGVPVYQEGMFLYTPDARFEVAWTCSGIRYLLAALSLGCLFAYLHFQIYSKRLLFILFSIALPILANGVRAWSIIMIYHFIDQGIAGDVDHLIYGWFFFSLVIGLLFLVGWWFAEPAQVDQLASTVNESLRQGADLFGHLSGIAALILAAVSLALVAVFAGNSQPAAVTFAAKPLPTASLGWQGPDSVRIGADALSWQPRFVNADHQWLGQYRYQGKVLYVYSAYYHQERQGKELVSVLNRLYNPSHWHVLSQNRFEGQFDQITLVANQLRLGNELGEQQFVYYWYQVGQHPSLGGINTKLQQWLHAPFGPSRGQVFAIMVPKQADLALVETFINQHLEGLKRWFANPVILAKEAKNGA
ncbi:exosortase A [Motilimonas eburnea]|uniref:exosortase A n=1 Tax=Motilimonas eburnea TaxID=1737488 RepID=UPI001E33E5E3|nr:exosortase A [Motilimonas eburnea]MCE2572189.1 EpsI family protein [Motilimonas eburnea]